MDEIQLSNSSSNSSSMKNDYDDDHTNESITSKQQHTLKSDEAAADRDSVLSRDQHHSDGDVEEGTCTASIDDSRERPRTTRQPGAYAVGGRNDRTAGLPPESSSSALSISPSISSLEVGIPMQFRLGMRGSADDIENSLRHSGHISRGISTREVLNRNSSNHPHLNLPEAILVEHAEVVESEDLNPPAENPAPTTVMAQQVASNNIFVADGQLVLPWYRRPGSYLIILVVVGCIVTTVLVTGIMGNDSGGDGDSDSSTFDDSRTYPSLSPNFSPTVSQFDIQYNALKNFYNLTSNNGTSPWINSDGWNSTEVVDTERHDVCEWYGITCTASPNRFVTEIDLSNNDLIGDMEVVSQALSGYLSSVEYLKSVDLRGNNITGQVTEELCGVTVTGIEQSLFLDCFIDCPCCKQTCECVDLVPGWVDDFGRGCLWYEQNNQCNADMISMSRSSNATTSYTQMDACCVCGGGTPVNPVPSLNPSASPTMNYGNVQYMALTELYTATNGDTWLNNDLWLSASASICDWYGVVCTNENSEIITALQLSANNLNGTIPAAIALLKELTDLELYENAITGVLPTELGMMQSLQNLYVYTNSLSGTIPSELGQLGESLKIMSLSRNNLDGTIPTEVGLLRSATQLAMSGNRLIGTIPSEILSLSSMYFFTSANNSLTGSIPSEIGQMSYAVGIALGHNYLSGTVPSEIGNLSNMYGFLLGGNDLTGTIPSEIGQLNSLGFLSIYDNSLSGSLPSEIAAPCNSIFSAFGALYVGYNSLTGSIPSEFGRCVYMEQLQLRYNSLSGTIPDELGKLNRLKILMLERNDLTGTMPESVCAFRQNDNITGSSQRLDLLSVDCDEVECDCCTNCA